MLHGIGYSINKMSYTISCQANRKYISASYHDRILHTYDIAYDIPCIQNCRCCLQHSMPFPVRSRACQGLFKCGPATALKQPRSDSDASQFESNAVAARPLRLSVFFGLENELRIHTMIQGVGATGSAPPLLPLPGASSSVSEQHDCRSSALLHTTPQAYA